LGRGIEYSKTYYVRCNVLNLEKWGIEVKDQRLMSHHFYLRAPVMVNILQKYLGTL
jgi:hypothetical protein